MPRPPASRTLGRRVLHAVLGHPLGPASLGAAGGRPRRRRDRSRPPPQLSAMDDAGAAERDARIALLAFDRATPLGAEHRRLMDAGRRPHHAAPALAPFAWIDWSASTAETL